MTCRRKLQRQPPKRHAAKKCKGYRHFCAHLSGTGWAAPPAPPLEAPAATPPVACPPAWPSPAEPPAACEASRAGLPARRRSWRADLQGMPGNRRGGGKPEFLGVYVWGGREMRSGMVGWQGLGEQDRGCMRTVGAVGGFVWKAARVTHPPSQPPCPAHPGLPPRRRHLTGCPHLLTGTQSPPQTSRRPRCPPAPPSPRSARRPR